MNHIFLLSESPDIQLKTNIKAGEEVVDVRQCVNGQCIGWSKNLEMVVCPLCQSEMVLSKKATPQIRAVNSCRNCFYLIKEENLCMFKEKKLSYHASDFSEGCGSYKLERKATKKERVEKESFRAKWKDERTC